MEVVTSLSLQFQYILILAIPVACVSWTITHEEIFREWREYCADNCKTKKLLPVRKFFYVFTCEYCFSHYVAIIFILLSKQPLLFFNWKGYLVAWLTLVWIANIYMSIYALIRLGIKKERTDISYTEEKMGNDSKK